MVACQAGGSQAEQWFPEMGLPKGYPHSWMVYIYIYMFILENPLQVDDLEVPQETSILTDTSENDGRGGDSGSEGTATM